MHGLRQVRPLQVYSAAARSVASMLRVMDGRTRRLAEIPAGRPGGVLIVRIHLASAVSGADGTDVRALLVGDLLMRACEARGVQVLHALAGPERSAEQLGLLRHTMNDLGIHPPASHDEAAGAHTDVYVSATAPPTAEAGVWVEVGPVRLQTAAIQGVWDGPGDTDGKDPLAARLALLATLHSRPVELTADALAEAGRTLSAWRWRVAAWADSPSRPVPGDLRSRADAALDDDLGTPGVLDVLREVVAADAFPDGAKFETFALLDRVLGLELAREVGRA